MQRRYFLQLATATAVFFNLPFAHASAAVATPVPTQTFPPEALQPNNLVVVSGQNQRVVDASFKALVETRAANGDRVAVLADEVLSYDIYAPGDTRGEVMLATELVPWLEEGHHLQKCAETRFWSRLREEPDAFAVQHFPTGCQFGRIQNPSEKYDFLAEAFMTGHSVITGVVAPDLDTVVDIFVSSVTDYYYRYDLDKLMLVHNGVDRSQEFRARLRTAWA